LFVDIPQSEICGERKMEELKTPTLAKGNNLRRDFQFLSKPKISKIYLKNINKISDINHKYQKLSKFAI
jgi:hypothetical protein